ncbi:MAG TPA: MerR family transcriptional regulator [Propioniciclava tarda]|nr:MerR family transcriptional regulator [Propioniciclava tarda]HQA30090.1 MerR family transcriptional regulator [Propioniciclava tarda]HQD59800.1 MerR family transcriptional regulator [Propioniciclava tarda]
MPPDRRSIGQVLKILVDEFPDISISKIRFLETEGLLSPERAPSGYRRYSEADIKRLRYILDVQKNHYLPLKVIREHLDLIDQGLEPPSLETPVPEPDLTPAPVTTGPTLASGPNPGKRPIHVTRRDLLRLSGLSDAALVELERHALVVPRRGTIFYGRDALMVAVAARKLAGYGMDARHLRAIKQAVEREVGLIDQAVNTGARRGQASRQAASDIMQLVMHVHAAILRQSISH